MVDTMRPIEVLAKPPATNTEPPKTQSLVVPPLGAFARSTLSGVYTADDARAGRDMYLGLCAGCHTAISHTGPDFRRKWAGRPLADLFSFMRINMPKNDPASLGDEDYGVLLAYILQLNKMPAGKTPLSTDSLDLAKIRIDTIRTAAHKTFD
jgi:mono/diheme cytochrome c family protein